MSSSTAPRLRDGPDISHLPDGALVAIFSNCSMRDRSQHLSLVCKRWHELCRTPSLVSQVAMPHSSGGAALLRLRSLQLWLPRHTPHVTQLSLRLSNVGQDEAEVLQLITASAISCGRWLEELTIGIFGQQPTCLTLSSWLCGLRGLTCLKVLAQRVHVAASLTSLTGLQLLSLGSHSAILNPKVSWLPPSITALGWWSTPLPDQVTALQQLQMLELRHLSGSALRVSLAFLSRMPSVHTLSIVGDLRAAPAELAALSAQLSQLHLSSTVRQPVEIGVLSSLSSLTLLLLQGCYGVAPSPSLQQLSRLQHLRICNGDSCDEHPATPAFLVGQPVLHSLPAGAWLGSLTHLELSYDALFGSLEVLPAATQLHTLAILRLNCMPAVLAPGEPQGRWADLQNWLCSHPPLQRISLVCWTSVRTEILDLVLTLAQRRPSLEIERRRAADA